MDLKMNVGMIAVWLLTLLPYIISISRKPFSLKIRIIWMIAAIVLPITIFLIILRLIGY